MPRSSPSHDDRRPAAGGGHAATVGAFAQSVRDADRQARAVADRDAAGMAGLRGRGRTAVTDATSWLGPGPGRTMARGLDRAARRGLASMRASPVRSMLVLSAVLMLWRWAGGRGR